MRPYPARSVSNSYEDKVFNYRLSRANHIMECCFGILTSRSRFFRSPFECKVSTNFATWTYLINICFHFPQPVLEMDLKLFGFVKNSQNTLIHRVRTFAVALIPCFTKSRSHQATSQLAPGLEGVIPCVGFEK